MNAGPALAPDAAMALGIAATAIPFAHTPADEAECWLRILRLHGRAGVALQALGVGEERLPASVEGDPERVALDPVGDPIGQVAGEAQRSAERRGATGIATTDVLLAVMRVYGGVFDRVLQAHGADREELTGRLGVEAPMGNAR